VTRARHARSRAAAAVFVDESGRRARWAHAALRGLFALCLVGLGLVVVSLLGGVPLPGLSAPVTLPSDEPAHSRTVPPQAADRVGVDPSRSKTSDGPRLAGVDVSASASSTSPASSTAPVSAGAAATTGGGSTGRRTTPAAAATPSRPPVTPSTSTLPRQTPTPRPSKSDRPKATRANTVHPTSTRSR
jgi:hypothetical protein